MTGTQAPTVKIPADIKDNSTYVVRIQWRGTRAAQPDEIESGRWYLATFGYTLYEWDDVDRTGARVTLHRFVNHEGQTVDLFATYYCTRVKCADCELYWSSVFQVVRSIGPGGTHEDSVAVPRCDYHADVMRRNCAGLASIRLLESEPLTIGQHD